jgi:hypothetical protein
MKKYYLHDGSESSGPFDIEELKSKKITKSSPVWFEGMIHWKTAGEIAELTELFAINPPPFLLFDAPKQNVKIDTKIEQVKILGLSKNTFFIVIAVIVLLAIITYFKNIEEERSRELEIKNKRTEFENYQFELKQKELEEQKIQAAIQEKIEAERKKAEIAQKDNNRILEIEKLIAEYQNNVTESEKKLDNTTDFKLLRTAAEKKEQLDLLEKNIDSFKTAIELLKNESGKLKLKLEKVAN